LVEQARKKLRSKNAAFVVANHLEDSPIGQDSTKVSLVDESSVEDLGVLSKEKTAEHIIEKVETLL